MGARHYTSAVDVWSVGCIMAELLSRRILFQAQTPMQQVCRVDGVHAGVTGSQIQMQHGDCSHLKAS